MFYVELNAHTLLKSHKDDVESSLYPSNTSDALQDDRTSQKNSSIRSIQSSNSTIIPSAASSARQLQCLVEDQTISISQVAAIPSPVIENVCTLTQTDMSDKMKVVPINHQSGGNELDNVAEMIIKSNGSGGIIERSLNKNEKAIEALTRSESTSLPNPNPDIDNKDKDTRYKGHFIIFIDSNQSMLHMHRLDRALVVDDSKLNRRMISKLVRHKFKEIIEVQLLIYTCILYF